MKLNKNITLTAVYQGVKPVIPGTLGKNKYVGYDHLFTDVEGPNFFYTNSRAKSILKEIPIGSKVRIKANWKSSIITSIKYIQIIE